jgi:hypothetical protein
MNELERLESFFGADFRQHWEKYNAGFGVDHPPASSAAGEIADAYVRPGGDSNAAGAGALDLNRNEIPVGVLSDSKQPQLDLFNETWVHQFTLALIRMWSAFVEQIHTILQGNRMGSFLQNVKDIKRSLDALQADVASFGRALTQTTLTSVGDFLVSIGQLVQGKLQTLVQSLKTFLSDPKSKLEIRNSLPTDKVSAFEEGAMKEIRRFEWNPLSHRSTSPGRVQIVDTHRFLERFHASHLSSSFQNSISKLQTIAADGRISLASSSSNLSVSFLTAAGACCVGLLTIAILRTAIDSMSQKKRNKKLEQEVENNVSHSEMERQRQRFRAVLGDQPSRPTESAVDSTVFAAVQMKGSNNKNKLHEEEDAEVGEQEEPSVEQPDTWDEETRRAWESFVQGSKIRQGELWTADDVDTGLPKIWVDVDKDRDD